MASGKIRGITVEIGGDTTKLGKALQSSEMTTKSLQSELRQVDKLLQFDPGNVDLLAQRQKILTQAVEETSEKLRILEQAEAQVVEQFNKGDIGEDQLRAFQREIIETQNKLSKFESELDGTGDSLKDVGDSAEKSGDGFTVFKGALADITANVIQAAISGIGNLVGSLLELSEATEEYRVMQAKLEGSSKSFGYSTEFAKKQYEEFYGYLGDDQMATNAITNLMGLGTSTSNVSALAQSAIAVWSAYGDSIPIEALTESVNETAQVGAVTGALADALNWAGISEDAFNDKLANLSTTEERANLIATTLNDTYGASKQVYDELNGSVTSANEAELALKDTQAQLGEAVAPVNTAITNLKNQALLAILPVIENVAGAFLKVHDYLQENETAMNIVKTVIIALASAFGVLAGALAIQTLISGVTKAFALLNTTLLANPITLIVALIASLVASIIYLWNNCDAFRNFWTNVWNGIKNIATTMINSIVTTIKTLPGKVKAIAGDIVTGLWQGMNNKMGWLKSRITSFVGNVTEFLKNLFGIESPSTLMRDEIGRYISEGIGVGIEQNKDKPLNALSDLSDEMINGEAMLNGATINRKLATTFSVGEVNPTANNESLLSKLDGIYERLNRMQIVLDTGTLVGETIDKIDAGLANRQLLSARGV